MGCGLQVNKTILVFLLLALIGTFVAVPLAVFTPQIYGRPNISLSNLEFIKDYIFSWWQKLFRRLMGNVGPAENVTVETSDGLKLSRVKPTENPQTAPEVVKYIQTHASQFSLEILNYLQANRLPNKSAQLDVLIVPDNLYVTFAWDGQTLTVYDGWQNDLGCNEWIQVVVTGDVVMQLWRNRDNVQALQSIILNADKNGELTYKLIRVNPITAELVLMFELLASLATIIGWTTLIILNLKGRR